MTKTLESNVFKTALLFEGGSMRAAYTCAVAAELLEQGIYFDNDAYIEFSTRTDGGARGGSYQVVVIDEAQELTETQLDALLPTASATGHWSRLR